MPCPSKVVILLKLKGCPCGTREEVSKPDEEQEQVKAEEALLATEGQLVQKRRPPQHKPTNVKYDMKMKPILMEDIDYTDDKAANCCQRCCGRKKKKRPPPGEEPQDMGVKPSQVEFNFSRHPYELTTFARPSNLKNLAFSPNKLYILGERGSGFKTKGDPQDFYKLRDDCLSKGIHFEDPEFPAVKSSVCFSGGEPSLKPLCDHLIWKRPKEMVSDPRLFVDGYSRFDVQQGSLGDCWLLAALANLTIYTRLFSQIVPDDQDFEDRYAGIFHFRFWQYGRWLDVVVDDKLPTIDGYKMPFLHSAQENEFWTALFEKAFAKLHGSYEALIAGTGSEAMTDLTGGVCEKFKTNEAPPEFFKILLKAYERASLMTCYLMPDANVIEAQTSEGLVRGHAYSITKVANVTLKNKQSINLIRLRNPWGNDVEWNGAWSDRSPEWNAVTPDEREKIGLTFENDGEFWMSFDDFMSRFSAIEVCNLNPQSVIYHTIDDSTKRWEMSMYEGEWVRGVTAGGCTNFWDTFPCNPQYRVTLTDPDDDDKDNLCTLIIALMQKNRRSLRPKGVRELSIGLVIFKVREIEKAPTPLDAHTLRGSKLVGRSKVFADERESTNRFKLPPGIYIIVPSTFEPNQEAEFLLRIFTEKRNIMTEHDNEQLCYTPPPTVETSEASGDQQDKEEVFKLFRRISGADEEVDWKELKQVLDSTLRAETKGRGFSSDICRSMIAMMDADLSGKLNFYEFERLWNSIIHWKDVFFKFDKDHSGTFSGFELREAMTDAGFKLNNRVLNKLMLRYGNKKGELNFEDFIMCAIKVRTLIDLFEYKAENKNIIMEIDQWLETTVSAT